MYVYNIVFCCFSASVIFSGILPRVPSAYQDMATPSWITDANLQACEINTLLQAMAKDRHLVDYVPHGEFSYNGQITKRLIARDGLHLARQGITTLASDITVCVTRLASMTRTSPVIKSSPTISAETVSVSKIDTQYQFHHN